MRPRTPPHLKRWAATLVFLGILSAPFQAAAVSGQLSVYTSPPAEISVDGKSYGLAPVEGINLRVGARHLQYQAKDKGTRVEFYVTISKGRHLICRYDFGTGEHRCNVEGISKVKALGRLRLHSNVSAEVYLDNNRIGKTPQDDYEVSAGPHTVEFRYADFEPQTKEIEVHPRETIMIEVKFEKGTPAAPAGAGQN